MTNAEYIKNMDNIDLAIFLERLDCSCCPAKTPTCSCYDKYVYCKDKILAWLKREHND